MSEQLKQLYIPNNPFQVSGLTGDVLETEKVFPIVGVLRYQDEFARVEIEYIRSNGETARQFLNILTTDISDEQGTSLNYMNFEQLKKIFSVRDGVKQ